MPASILPRNILRSNRKDAQIVDVTVWTSGKVTDEDGNVTIDEQATPIILKGWDIQPLVASTPPVIDQSGFTYVIGLSRAFVPPEHISYWVNGRLVKNNSTGQTYRMGPIQDWKTHAVIVLEVSS